jgi:hypothetical protein
VKIYIAGSSHELDLVSRYMRAVERQGHELTYDWVSAVKQEGAANAITLEKACTYAQLDLDAVAQAHVLWLLVPDIGGRGCWVEYGFALASDDIVTVVSGVHAVSIFSSLADHRFGAHDDALSWLNGAELENDVCVS